MAKSKSFGFLVEENACFAMKIGPGRVGLSLMQGDLISNISIDAVARAMAAALISAADQADQPEGRT